MKQLMMAALLATTFGSSALLAGQEGGGGGGICIDGKCRTLAEAGVRIKAGSAVAERWYITPNVLKQISIIAKNLPFGGDYIEKMAIGNYSTFSPVEVVNKRLMKEVVSDYKDVLKKTNNTSLAKNLEIFAISNNSTTYLMPKFFKLSDYQKALILFHEGIVRTQEQNYLLALAFDGEYLDYVNRKNIPNYSPLLFFRILAELTGDKTSQIPVLLDYVEEKLGRPLALSDFSDNSSFIREGKISDIAPKALSLNQAVMGDYIEIFARARVSSSSVFSNYIKENFSRDEIIEACSSTPKKSARLAYLSEYEGSVFVDCQSLDAENLYGVFLGLTNLNSFVD